MRLISLLIRSRLRNYLLNNLNFNKVKRIIIVLMLFTGFANIAKSQTSTSGAITLQGTHTNTLGLDTLGASDTIYFKNAASLASIGLEGNYRIDITLVSISGTVTMTATLESSTDGVVWTPGINKIPGTDGIKSDTLIITSAGTKKMTISSNAPKSQIASAGVINTYYTDLTRSYWIRVKLLSPVTAQSTKVYMRLSTQN